MDGELIPRGTAKGRSNGASDWEIFALFNIFRSLVTVETHSERHARAQQGAHAMIIHAERWDAIIET